MKASESQNPDLMNLRIPVFCFALLAGCAGGTDRHELDPAERPASVESVVVQPADPVAAVSEQQAHPIDKQLQICQEAENWTTQGVNVCLDKTTRSWDAEMNRVYQELLTLLDEEQEKPVREAQRPWMVFRDAELESAGLTYQYGMGTS
ncbi:MAG: hypothetical protein ACI80V_000718 [Rhodothermales bacterium]|jgi:uncharacterized protein YecT (DUF1311 family)